MIAKLPLLKSMIIVFSMVLLVGGCKSKSKSPEGPKGAGTKAPPSDGKEPNISSGDYNQAPPKSPLDENSIVFSGLVERSCAIGSSGDGKGTICLSIVNFCPSQQSIKNIVERKLEVNFVALLPIKNVDLSSQTTHDFSFNMSKDKINAGNYQVIGVLQENGGECSNIWRKDDIVTWQDVNVSSSPCASFNYTQGKNITGLKIKLNALIKSDIELP